MAGRRAGWRTAAGKLGLALVGAACVAAALVPSNETDHAPAVLLMGAGAATVGILGGLDGDSEGWAVAVIGGGFFTPIGLVGLWACRRRMWLGFSDRGVTVCGWASHFLLPWDAVTDVGVIGRQPAAWGTTRGPSALGLAADIDQARGHVSGWLRRTGRWRLYGFNFSFPQTLFDAPVGELAVLAVSYRDADAGSV